MKRISGGAGASFHERINDEKFMIMQNKRLIGLVLVVAVLLLIPLIAGFPWTRLDFVVAGVLLLGTGLWCELVIRKVKKFEYRIVFCGALLTGLLFIWAAIVSAE